jgi:Tol biopolymer transport system component
MRKSAVPAMIMMTGLAGAATSETPAFVTVRQADKAGSAWEIPAPSISRDGRYIAFASYAQLTPADTNALSDIYVLDRARGKVTLETGHIADDMPDRDCLTPGISDDGRFVVYETVRSDSDGTSRRVIELRDRSRGTTRFIQGRSIPNGGSRRPTISRDGRIVAFTSAATNLTDDADANGALEDVYTFDTASGRIARVSLDSSGHQPAHGASFAPAVSADGRFVAFTSTSAFGSAAPPTSKPVTNVYVRDTRLGITTRVSDCRRSTEPNGNSYDAAISGDGRYVVFTSEASNLLSGDTNDASDVFLRDVQAGKTTMVSRGVSGASANGPSGRASISATGEIVAFQSDASDLVCGSRCAASEKDINLVSDVFVFSVAHQRMNCLSTGRMRWMEPSGAPAVNGAGDIIVFSSRHPIDAQDTANDFDLFVGVRSGS